MQIETLIQNLKMLKAEIEWDHSIYYQTVLDNAIKILEGVRDGSSKAVDG